MIEATAGGTRTHILQLIYGLTARNFRVTLVASVERDGRFRRDIAQLRAAGVRVIDAPMMRRIAPWRDAAALFRLRTILRSLDADIVHTHASKAGMLGRLAARLSGCRVVIHTPHVYYFQGKRGMLRRFFRMVERMALPLAGRTVLLCETQRKLAIEELGANTDQAGSTGGSRQRRRQHVSANAAGGGSPPARRGSRLVVIENGVDTLHFRPRKTRREAQEALGIRPGRAEGSRQRRRQPVRPPTRDLTEAQTLQAQTQPVEALDPEPPEDAEMYPLSPQAARRGSRLGAPTFGTVTRLRPQKGCDVFLKAVARVFEEIPVCNCVFVGEGPLDAKLRRLARRLGVVERMVWREYTEDPREIYEALDVFVMSSRYEGMPYAMLEAMSMGLPVVAARVCGCQDVVEEGVTGLLVAPDRPDELAQEILRLLRDPEHAQRMGAAAREAVEREFSSARFLDRMADLYISEKSE